MKKILIANRGEIAMRIIRTCREMGIKTVAVYSEADRESLHVRFADEAVCIGPAPSKDSYLNIPAIISAAEITNADGIHPGFGFLSENAKFSRICAEHGIKFIGATPDQINKMGDKATAKETMKAAGVPCVPGSDGLLEDLAHAKKTAKEIGYPVMMKATAGGGGKGMRAIWKEDELEKAWESARQEAAAAFGNDGMYMEKLIEEPRHITVEFLVDKHRNFYFMEMNTRIQVEHPITEEVTDYDLIREQIKIATGTLISGRNHEPKQHAIECRINAEDPYANFRPSPGKITAFHAPGGHGVRIDTHVYAGYTIPSNYDSMIAKLIVTGRNRQQAIERMKRALDEFIIEGIKTTIPFHRQLMDHPDYVAGNYTTKFMEDFEMN
ncbi:MAG: ATP-grasp domain-containing protein [Flavobacteriia bacterium]|nr:ATP-grasp domain-containing protein [Flavobacteriia bacterium]